MGKDTILNKIKKNKGQFVELPEIPNFSSNQDNMIKHFTESIKKAGGDTVFSANMSLQSLIEKHYPKAQNIISCYGNYKGSLEIVNYTDPHELKDIELAIIKGTFGLAENGAIWIDEKEMVHRALPFITENLIIVLEKDKLVENMHEAYGKLKGKQTGFGLFISGPSKTADIEQALVIGAHGAKSLYVYLT
jgi:L-lactate dehydrogenase complex protein LldG